MALKQYREYHMKIKSIRNFRNAHSVYYSIENTFLNGNGISIQYSYQFLNSWVCLVRSVSPKKSFCNQGEIKKML